MGGSQQLLIPAMGLICLAWIVPKLLSMVMPEGVRPLMLLALLSSLILSVIVALFFIVLYVQNGVPLSRIFDLGFWGIVVFFGKLSVAASLIWAPIMILSVSALPRTWVSKVW